MSLYETLQFDSYNPMPDDLSERVTTTQGADRNKGDSSPNMEKALRMNLAAQEEIRENDESCTSTRKNSMEKHSIETPNHPFYRSCDSNTLNKPSAILV